MSLLSILLVLYSGLAFASDYKLWFGARTQARANYELALTRLLLEETKQEFGKYTLTIDTGVYSTARRYQLFDSDSKINLTINPYHKDSVGREDYILSPLMGGLLGIRKIITTDIVSKEIESVKTLSHLKQFSIGQGPEWTEVRIYRNSGFEVFESDFDTLFRMVASNRFHVLPLGVVEIDGEIQGKINEFSNIVTIDGLYIYYPQPVFMQIEKSNAQAVARFNRGIEMIKSNGKLSLLFNKHFGMILERIHSSKASLIPIENPHLPDKYHQLLKESENYGLIQKMLQNR